MDKQKIIQHFGKDWRPFFEKYLSHELKGSGKQLQAKCPFHDDENPSLSIDSESGLWNCFTCGEGVQGDAFSFYAKSNNLDVRSDFNGIVENIATDFGITDNGHTKPSTVPSSPICKGPPFHHRELGLSTQEYPYTDDDGNIISYNCRFTPNSTDKKPFRQCDADGVWKVSHLPRVLYHQPKLKDASTVCICEGEKDVHSLEALGLVATTNLSGGTAWKESDAKQLHGKKEIIIFEDNDKTGRERTQKILESFNGNAGSVKVIRFEGERENFDVTDFITQCRDDNEALLKLSEKVEEAGPVAKSDKKEQIAMAPEELSSLEYPLFKLKAVINNHLYLEDDRVIDVIAGTYIANKLSSDPLWMQIVAPPATAKTELLRSFDGHAEARFISTLTPSTLASGIKPKPGLPEPSLLYQLNDKLVILKDFTSILSMRHEHKSEIIAQLREAYDGRYDKLFGNGKRVMWEGKFGLISACTTAWDKHQKAISNFGDRFLVYRTPSPDPRKAALTALRLSGKEPAMRAEISQAMHRFVDQFKNVTLPEITTPDAVNNKLVDLAIFCAVGRCGVDRDPYTREITYLPDPEGPSRLAKQLATIGKGIAISQGKATIDEGVYDIVKKIGIDLVEPKRMKALESLRKFGAFESEEDGWVTTTEIANHSNMHVKTTLTCLEDMMMVGILNRDKRELDDGIANVGTVYIWQVTNQIMNHAGNAGIL